MVKDKKGLILGISALVTFVVGGLATFAGLALLGFMKHKDVLGLGDGRSIGVSLIIMGLFGSIVGVLMMRFCRNRF
ncbi:hypothetical protein GMST_01690 [Geomonas silvestris]|uniref:Uncharacterized protein n=1 Tax=Geomonas silvestris TaxID=2740184 RepID=A0A6V8MD65_9BACT|nr:hypothetical protein [Geomonas silvestris]GFO57844.1 hypothetical protein GMST_01690 [Geomonas silvestris]